MIAGAQDAGFVPVSACRELCCAAKPGMLLTSVLHGLQPRASIVNLHFTNSKIKPGIFKYKEPLHLKASSQVILGKLRNFVFVFVQEGLCACQGVITQM